MGLCEFGLKIQVCRKLINWRSELFFPHASCQSRLSLIDTSASARWWSPLKKRDLKPLSENRLPASSGSVGSV